MAHERHALWLKPCGAQRTEHRRHLVGTVAECELAAVAQRTGGTLRHVCKGAASVMARRGPARVGADRPGREIRRVAGRKIVLSAFRPGGAEIPQVGADRRDMRPLGVGGGRRRAERRGIRVNLKRRAGAAVPRVMPCQRDNAAPAAEVERTLPRPRAGKAGQKKRIGPEPGAGRGKNPRSAVKNFLTMFHFLLLSVSAHRRRRTDTQNSRCFFKSACSPVRFGVY